MLVGEQRQRGRDRDTETDKETETERNHHIIPSKSTHRYVCGKWSGDPEKEIIRLSLRKVRIFPDENVRNFPVRGGQGNLLGRKMA